MVARAESRDARICDVSRRETHTEAEKTGSGHRENKKTRRRKRRLIAVEIACAVVIVLAGAYMIQQFSRYYIADRDFQDVTRKTESSPAKAKQFNGDCVGWIKVKDTRIDYPVMYTARNPEYYLHRNFEKEDSFAGTPFMGEGSQPENPKANSQIVYAHHMRDGSMFGQLERFNDKDWAESHVIRYRDNDGTHKYHAFAAMYVDLSGNSNPYEYWNHVGVLSKTAYREFVKDVNGRSLYSTKWKAKYGQKIMMLSTCSYGTSEQRFVVFGVTAD